MGTPSTFIFSFALVLVTGGSPTVGQRLRNGEPCNTPGFFGDSEDCRNFYRCAEHPTADGSPPQLIKFSFRCPSGTVFDESLSTCNHPDAVPDKPGICQIYDPGDGQAAPEPIGGHALNQLLFHAPVIVPQYQIVQPGLAVPYATMIQYG